MTVTEMRIALQALEAQGKGGLPIVIREIVDYDGVWAYSEPGPPCELQVDACRASASVDPGTVAIAIEAP